MDYDNTWDTPIANVPTSRKSPRTAQKVCLPIGINELICPLTPCHIDGGFFLGRICVAANTLTVVLYETIIKRLTEPIPQ